MQVGDVTDSVVYWVNVVTVWSDNMRCHVTCSRNQTVLQAVCESAVFLKDKELSRQLASGTRIREFVCGFRKDVVSKFCDSVNNW